MIQSPLPDIDLTDVRLVSMMIRSLRFQIKVTDHTSLTRSLVSPDTRPPSTVPCIAQPDKGIGSNQVYAPDIAVASTSISDGIERAPNRLRVKSLIRTGSLESLPDTRTLFQQVIFSKTLVKLSQDKMTLFFSGGLILKESLPDTRTI